MLTYFGPPVDAPAWEDAVQAPTPVGQPCAMCGEGVVDGDRGWIIGAITATGEAETVPTHAECQLAAVLGHYVGACSHHMPDASVRELGRAAWDRVFGSAR